LKLAAAMNNWVPLFAALIAASAAVIGYLLTYRSRRLDAKAEAYAKALATIEAYKQLPYRIRRRTQDDAKVRAELGGHISDVQQEIAFHRRWLTLDSEIVGEAYDRLVANVYRDGAEHRRRAWKAAPCTKDADMGFNETFPWKDEKYMDACITAMRRELRWRRFP
jgi:hypothetical protein